MYCAECGYEHDDQARFCAKCGTALQSVGDTHDTDQRPITTVRMEAYAGFWLRFVAAIIDNIVSFIIYLALALIIGFTIGLSVETEWELIQLEDTLTFLDFLLALVVCWFYWALMEISPKQATLGKMAVGIVVTDMGGGRISFWKATGRYFAKYISTLFLFIGFIIIPFTKKKQGLHDILAECLVVKR